jgi:hypothetical protein
MAGQVEGDVSSWGDLINHELLNNLEFITLNNEGKLLMRQQGEDKYSVS